MMVLRIEGMGCQGCVGTVQGALEAVDNVVHARVDLKDKLAYVSGSAAAEELIAAVTAKGKRAELVGRTGGNGFAEMTAAELKASLQRSGGRGLVLDIDETLSATNVAWFERLEELFGNPEDIPREELIRRYTYAQNVPFWKTPLALAWMQRQRDDPKAQDGLPLIAGAVEGVHALRQVVPIVGYATVRLDTTNANTIAWLREHGFPDVPVVAKPASVPFADGNKWKAAALHEMWPEVQGIVDDNPKVPAFAGRGYPGIIYLFGHTQSPPGLDFAVPCGSWRDVVAAAQGSRS